MLEEENKVARRISREVFNERNVDALDDLLLPEELTIEFEPNISFPGPKELWVEWTSEQARRN